MKKLLFVSAVLAVSTVAVAGSSGGQQVNIWTDSAGQTNANGTFKAVRNSADTQQYIGCSLYAYDTSSFSATCYATSATGQYASCFTSDANMLKVVQTLNPASYLYFVVNADGSCDRVISVNASYNLP
ncbi:hypothetical protein [Vitiosangium sp. GDMCC 1.1324]|uniref:hypothetical protein n=1 Tax=Vitiosangium sp. (strain GDMCC 1.1324) TaxID=2138576 RepID=UPI000D365DF7|nr:hypothetical protein [Vitiosangium sp. GDMCC 1.1324]PTL83002.1 hypothetical protein DAT35_13345 [Vitiosangium sp. GDMCC 1.1324]